MEEGVGNAHPNHALANSSQTKGGNNSSSPPQSEHGGDGGEDEEKSVLQVKIQIQIEVKMQIQKTNTGENTNTNANGGENTNANLNLLNKSLLQAKLTNLAINIGYGGMAISFVTVPILFIRFSIDEFYYRVSFAYSFFHSNFLFDSRY